MPEYRMSPNGVMLTPCMRSAHTEADIANRKLIVGMGMDAGQIAETLEILQRRGAFDAVPEKDREFLEYLIGEARRIESNAVPVRATDLAAKVSA